MVIGCEKMNCEIQEKCGGCVYGKKQYAQQLKDKTEYVEKQLKKLKQNIKVNYCIGMENPYNYRNKESNDSSSFKIFAIRLFCF